MPAACDDIRAALVAGGMMDANDLAPFTALTGGVSSDIWRVDLPTGPICVKRALAKLKVEDDWHAPVSRNAYEVAWIRVADAIVPGSAPDVLFHDPDSGLFAMPYLDPATHPLWKAQLRDGKANPDEAHRVGETLGRIHAATAVDPSIPNQFQTDEIFHAIRLEPYLLATAKRHPDLASRLRELSDITARNKVALVHGDVSPKNILIGPDGPVFLDAECAWFGDPAFDVAFCLNHLLLKCLWAPQARPAFETCFKTFCHGYEDATRDLRDRNVMTRTAHLLAGLFLARIDGKSPVEYIEADADKDLVRETARHFLTTPAGHPIEVAEGWHRRLLA